MSRNKLRTINLLLLGGLSLGLASCSSKEISNYPSNKGDNIVNGIVGDDIVYNEFEDFYDNISGGTTIQAKALNDILYRIANEKLTIDQSDLQKKIEDTLISEVNTGTYDTDYQFNELRFALSLRSNFYNITCGPSDANAKKGIVITPDLKYADVFGCDYTDYIERQIKPTIIRRMLVAQYIYDDSYSSIGNTYARKVDIVKITERSDKSGSAIKTIKAFVENYLVNKDATKEQRSLSNLARIWLGTDLTESDKKFITDNGLVTLKGQIEDEVAKIDFNDIRKSDLTMETKYTNSYAYSVEKGVKLAEDNLSRTDLITDGYFLKSSGLSSFPTAIKDRVFTTNYTLDAKPGEETKDATLFVGDNRYLIPAKIEDKDDLISNLVHYDAGTSSYYIIEIKDIITNAALRVLDSDSEEVKADKKSRALKVAYELATTSTYITDSTVYWLKNSDIKYSDKAFYDYILSTYPDVFEEEDE